MAKGIPLMGRDPDGKAKMINVDENGNVKVQLSGNIVEEIISTAANPILLTNTRLYISQTISTESAQNNLDLRQYKNVTLAVKNLHNRTIELRIELKFGAPSGALGHTIIDYKKIPANGVLIISQHNYPELEASIPYVRCTIRPENDILPTSGYVLISVHGEAR